MLGCETLTPCEEHEPQSEMIIQTGETGEVTEHHVLGDHIGLK